jgi:hypothetical protein
MDAPGEPGASEAGTPAADLRVIRIMGNDRVTGRGLALGAIDHAIGCLVAGGVLVVSEPIANAGSAATSWLLEHLVGGNVHAFVLFEWHLSSWGLVAILALLGTTVAGVDLLVRNGWVRTWLVVPAVFALAILTFAALLADGEGGWRGGLIVGGGLGLVLGSALAAWWITLTAIRRLRERLAKSGGKVVAG